MLPPVVLAAETSPEGEAPDWVHLLPVSEGQIQTADERGPYHVTDAAAFIAASLPPGDKLPIDQDHATDLAAPHGLPAPARGWIVEMQARADGVWGRVEWTREGRELVVGRAYRALSPVTVLGPGKRLVRMLRASLVNKPNFRGLATLNQETDMPSMKMLAEALGLAEDATEEQLLAAIAELKKKPAPELQAAVAEIGTALGVEGGDAKAILAAAKIAKAGTAEVVALQAQVTELGSQLKDIQTARARAASEAYVDAALRAGRTGVRKNNRDELVELHMEQPAVVENLIGGMPIVPPGERLAPPARIKEGEIALSAEQATAARLLGIPAEAYTKTLAAEHSNEETV